MPGQEGKEKKGKPKTNDICVSHDYHTYYTFQTPSVEPPIMQSHLVLAPKMAVGTTVKTTREEKTHSGI